MKIIWAVFKNEGLDTLRDRRAIIAMIVIPMVIFPVIFGGLGFFAIKEVKKAQEKVLKIGLIQAPESPLVDSLTNQEGFELSDLPSGTDAKDQVDNNGLDAVIVFNESFAD